MDRLGARWKKSLRIWPGEVSGGLGTQTGQFLKRGKWRRRRRRPGTQHCSSAADFRKGQHKTRGGKEHKDQALLGEREFSGQQ